MYIISKLFEYKIKLRKYISTNYPTFPLSIHDNGQHQTHKQTNAQNSTDCDVKQTLQRYRFRFVAKQTVAILVTGPTTSWTRDAREIADTRLNACAVETLQRLVGNVVAKVAQTSVCAS